MSLEEEEDAIGGSSFKAFYHEGEHSNETAAGGRCVVKGCVAVLFITEDS